MPEPKFLLDADMPRSSADVISSLGYDVRDVRDLGMRYAEDRAIIEYAQKSNRVLVTRDLDFGSILQYPNHPGAIILRLPSEYTAKELSDVLRDFLSSTEAQILQKATIIVELGRYRRRSLKESGQALQ
jgi:predicted nuclease of predicted toxin-antitoxin system